MKFNKDYNINYKVSSDLWVSIVVTLAYLPDCRRNCTEYMTMMWH